MSSYYSNYDDQYNLFMSIATMKYDAHYTTLQKYVQSCLIPIEYMRLFCYKSSFKDTCFTWELPRFWSLVYKRVCHSVTSELSKIYKRNMWRFQLYYILVESKITVLFYPIMSVHLVGPPKLLELIQIEHKLILRIAHQFK